ncbi:hypothetical protein HDU93_001213 [Gonapodya sp. JEL0774]|nr:hypothetical protein HDU93_001213 [Gonapodya sp. JEL0774]
MKDDHDVVPSDASVVADDSSRRGSIGGMIGVVDDDSPVVSLSIHPYIADAVGSVRDFKSFGLQESRLWPTNSPSTISTLAPTSLVSGSSSIWNPNLPPHNPGETINLDVFSVFKTNPRALLAANARSPRRNPSDVGYDHLSDPYLTSRRNSGEHQNASPPNKIRRTLGGSFRAASPSPSQSDDLATEQPRGRPRGRPRTRGKPPTMVSSISHLSSSAPPASAPWPTQQQYHSQRQSHMEGDSATSGITPPASRALRTRASVRTYGEDASNMYEEDDDNSSDLTSEGDVGGATDSDIDMGSVRSGSPAPSMDLDIDTGDDGEGGSRQSGKRRRDTTEGLEKFDPEGRYRVPEGAPVIVWRGVPRPPPPSSLSHLLAPEEIYACAVLRIRVEQYLHAKRLMAELSFLEKLLARVISKRLFLLPQQFQTDWFVQLGWIPSPPPVNTPEYTTAAPAGNATGGIW